MLRIVVGAAACLTFGAVADDAVPENTPGTTNDEEEAGDGGANVGGGEATDAGVLETSDEEEIAEEESDQETTNKVPCTGETVETDCAGTGYSVCVSAIEAEVTATTPGHCGEYTHDSHKFEILKVSDVPKELIQNLQKLFN